ncbi:MAG: penicillin-binding protein 1C [Hyphomicrobiaceae bacterium]
MRFFLHDRRSEATAAGARAQRAGWRRAKRLMLASAFALAALGGGTAWMVSRVAAPTLERTRSVSVMVLDREDRLLRAFTAADGRWRLPVAPNAVDPRYLAMLVAYEDRRFHVHSGVDPWSVVRAAGLFLRYGRIVSGASTLTMQTARLLEGHHPRTASGKLRQMAQAIQLERHWSKKEILAAYLLLAPFGGNIEGARAASLAYFGKEPKRLSIAEAALLVALPQSPEARRPDRHSQAAKRARSRVLARARAAGVISAEEQASALREPIPSVRREFPKLAPHLAEAEVARAPEKRVHRLTLDRHLQEQLERLARQHALALGSRLSTALIAVDHETGRVLAQVASAGYLDEGRQGAVDMTDAVRSPGSTLKPLIYGLGFESGLIHPETLIEDRPARFGLYTPKNFDEDFHGTVTIREALGQSLNIPAVKVLAQVGPVRMLGRLRRIGVTPELPGQSEPTLAVALGGLGLKMTDLARLYVAMARGGTAIPIMHRRDGLPARAVRKAGRRLLSPVASWYIADILKDAPPPANAKGGGLAYKTGTSYGYRDAWAAGFDGRTTIVVWVGRPDNSSTPGLTGRSAAAPLLFDAFAQLSDRPRPLVSAPRGVIRASTSALPPPLRRFRDPGEDGNARGPFLEPPVAIAFPPDRSELETTDVDEAEALVLKAEGGALPLTWLVDGAPLTTDPARRDVSWTPKGLGFATISVIDARGRSDRVQVRLK